MPNGFRPKPLVWRPLPPIIQIQTHFSNLPLQVFHCPPAESFESTCLQTQRPQHVSASVQLTSPKELPSLSLSLSSLHPSTCLCSSGPAQTHLPQVSSLTSLEASWALSATPPTAPLHGQFCLSLPQSCSASSHVQVHIPLCESHQSLRAEHTHNKQGCGCWWAGHCRGPLAARELYFGQQSIRERVPSFWSRI